MENSNLTKKIYSQYYKNLHSPIGGDERFLWINNVLLKNIEDKCILDVGSGEGSLLKMLQDKNNKVFGIEASETGQLACREKGVACSSIDISREKFPYPDSNFDIVLCLEVMEHLENPYHCLCEINRVLKDKGLFITSIPNPKMLHPYIYPGLFTVNNFKNFLELNSFKITKITGWGQIAMFNKASRWLKSKNNTWAKSFAGFIHYLSRKRNAFLRNHLKTPLGYSHAINFVCINYKTNKTILEKLAEETIPE
ncbi:MAG: class I SAM-dependent methyltransferase [Candidatus Omnitrophota bacterium]